MGAYESVGSKVAPIPINPVKGPMKGVAFGLAGGAPKTDEKPAKKVVKKTSKTKDKGKDSTQNDKALSARIAKLKDYVDNDNMDALD